ncbi:MAG: pyridoxine 5'-phosphate synthase [Planctomycetota bacterium]|nr:pyridoxine 5'-phosphate synthase [Planctomycetota bacterium]
MPGLGVNIDHVATVRQARRTVEPDPVWAAAQAELGGADGITFHLRVDRRHINDRDARLLAQTVHVKLNMEMSMEEEIVAIAMELAPDQVTLVPEKRQELTTEGGLDCLAHAHRLAQVTAAMHERGVEVSAFVDPSPPQILAARDAGCDAVELHTGRYAHAFVAQGRRLDGNDRARMDIPADSPSVAQAMEELQAGLEAGLIVHGGHGLTYENVGVIARLPGFSEFNIGHSIVARALFAGLREAVAEMKRLITQPALD